MRILLILVPFFLIGCSGSKKKADVPESSPSQEESKSTKTMADKKLAPATQSTTCSLGKDKRVLTERPSEGALCEVAYEKFGETSVIATATRDASHCSQVMDRVAQRLKEAGFSCE